MAAINNDFGSPCLPHQAVNNVDSGKSKGSQCQIRDNQGVGIMSKQSLCFLALRSAVDVVTRRRQKLLHGLGKQVLVFNDENSVALFCRNSLPYTRRTCTFSCKCTLKSFLSARELKTISPASPWLYCSSHLQTKSGKAETHRKLTATGPQTRLEPFRWLPSVPRCPQASGRRRSNPP